MPLFLLTDSHPKNVVDWTLSVVSQICSSKTFKIILLTASSYVFLHTRIRSRTLNIRKGEINIRSLKENTTGCTKYATVQMQGL